MSEGKQMKTEVDNKQTAMIHTSTHGQGSLTL